MDHLALRHILCILLTSRDLRRASRAAISKEETKKLFSFFFFFTGGTLGCNVSSFINVTAGCELITSLTVWLHSPSDEAK